MFRELQDTLATSNVNWILCYKYLLNNYRDELDQLLRSLNYGRPEDLSYDEISIFCQIVFRHAADTRKLLLQMDKAYLIRQGIEEYTISEDHLRTLLGKIQGFKDANPKCSVSNMQRLIYSDSAKNFAHLIEQ